MQWVFLNFFFYLDIVLVLLASVFFLNSITLHECLFIVHMGRVCYGPTLLCVKSIWMNTTCSARFPINSYYYACHLYILLLSDTPFQMKISL